MGKIIQCERHENADTLYVSQVQIKDEPELQNLQICSGLVKYLTREQLLNQEVIVLANLKASKMRGVKSEAMLLAAERKKDGDELEVALVKPPSGSKIGERLFFENFKSTDSPSKLKSSAWQDIQSFLKTDSQGQARYEADENELFLLKNEVGNCATSIENSIIR